MESEKKLKSILKKAKAFLKLTCRNDCLFARGKKTYLRCKRKDCQSWRLGQILEGKPVPPFPGILDGIEIDKAPKPRTSYEKRAKVVCPGCDRVEWLKEGEIKDCPDCGTQISTF